MKELDEASAAPASRSSSHSRVLSSGRGRLARRAKKEDLTEDAGRAAISSKKRTGVACKSLQAKNNIQ
jgi:hypothetical protein